MEKEEPGILNSNLFPVKAIGLVLFLSVVSFGISGRTWTPRPILSFFLPLEALPEAIASSISVKSSPRNMETIAGGASLAPSLWSLPALATEILNRS